MPSTIRIAATPVAVFLLALVGIVYVWSDFGGVHAQFPPQKSAKSAAAPAKPAVEVRHGAEGLPAPVQEMREAILSAVHSGRIEDLRTAVELNELRPAVAEKAVPDPIAYWRETSGDGEGRDILAALGQLLDSGYVVLPLGRDLENNRVYVWPYFAEMAIDKLTPAQEVELLRLVPAAAFNDMKKSGRYTYYKLGIGADGTWHFFIR